MFFIGLPGIFDETHHPSFPRVSAESSPGISLTRQGGDVDFIQLKVGFVKLEYTSCFPNITPHIALYTTII